MPLFVDKPHFFPHLSTNTPHFVDKFPFPLPISTISPLFVDETPPLLTSRPQNRPNLRTKPHFPPSHPQIHPILRMTLGAIGLNPTHPILIPDLPRPLHRGGRARISHISRSGAQARQRARLRRAPIARTQPSARNRRTRCPAVVPPHRLPLRFHPRLHPYLHPYLHSRLHPCLHPKHPQQSPTIPHPVFVSD